MKTGDLKNIKIARKYADALYKSAQDENLCEKIYNETLFIYETLKSNNNLNEFLQSPLIKNDDKKDVINKLFTPHTDKLLVNFLNILIDEGRFNALNEIINKYSEIYYKEKNIIKPVIISAVELDDNQKQAVLNKLETKLKKHIEPEYIINNDIIGGLIIEIDDKTIDCSIKTKFDNMRKELAKGN